MHDQASAERTGESAQAFSADPAERQAGGLRVLVIDDDAAIRRTLGTLLTAFGCRVDVAGEIDAAVHLARLGTHDLAFCDLRLGERSGIDLLPKLLAVNPDLQIVLITAFASIETAVLAMKAGAANYLAKPFASEQVKSIVEQVARERRLAQTLGDFERRLRHAVPEIDLQSRSPGMQAAYRTIARAAVADVPVLLRGESGTGKGMLAQALHLQSPRHQRPFVTVNCPSLSDELLASELFGHIKGSFTGAVRDQPGKVESANGGTLFLDELADMSRTVQAKLLRFLQERRYERLGDTRTQIADVRVVTATNRDLEAQVRDGTFREDLLYRLNVVEVMLPPLRERREDLIEMAKHFLGAFAKATDRGQVELSPAAQAALLAYDWPGNIRELRNEMQRVTVLWPSRVIEPEAFSKRLVASAANGPRLGGECSLADIESEHIRKILLSADTFDEAAQILGIEPSTLWRKRKRLGL